MKRIDMNELLALLTEKVKHQPNKFHFSAPANEVDLARTEFLLGVELPKTYREFLLTFNGGFICNTFLAAKIKLNNDIETARWNSLNIFSLEEFHQEYIDLSDRNWKMPLEWDGVYPIIPFARTETNELLVFAQPLNSEFESPVFDAFHEDPVHDWGVLYKDFSEMLHDYISKEGKIKTIAPAKAETMKIFLPESGWKQKPDEWENHEKVLEYNFEMLKTDPDNSDTFLNIAEAMIEKEEFLSAKFYLQKALQIDPDDDYAYYLKGRMLADQENFSDAVQAISKAISLSENQAFFYILRSNYLFELKKYDEAMLDCNKSMELDPISGYTYLCRSELNLKLNKPEQAFSDIQKSVELEPDNPLYLAVLADYYMEQKNYLEAINICTEAIKFDPTYLRAHITRENAYRALGETEKADAESTEIEDILRGE